MKAERKFVKPEEPGKEKNDKGNKAKKSTKTSNKKVATQ